MNDLDFHLINYISNFHKESRVKLFLINKYNFENLFKPDINFLRKNIIIIRDL